MPQPIITLTTDFGEESPYVAAMKGVILGVNPEARVIDLCHQIGPQDVRHAAFFLAEAIPYFPSNTVHVVVVDPDVGTERALLYVEIAGQRLLAPDNGCWTWLARNGLAPTRVLRLTEPRFWRQSISATFHGRDILAPVAGHISRGVDPADLGPQVSEWVSLQWPLPSIGKKMVQGEVVFADHFGNLITNIPATAITGEPGILKVGKKKFRRGFRWVRTYAEAKPGTLVALIGSSGTMEVALVQGNAAQKLRAGNGTPIGIGWRRLAGR
jgi:S-adenosylmethionine hydrolase